VGARYSHTHYFGSGTEVYTTGTENNLYTTGTENNVYVKIITYHVCQMYLHNMILAVLYYIVKFGLYVGHSCQVASTSLYHQVTFFNSNYVSPTTCSTSSFCSN
jgi:hypothetical protein